MNYRNMFKLSKSESFNKKQIDYIRSGEDKPLRLEGDKLPIIHIRTESTSFLIRLIDISKQLDKSLLKLSDDDQVKLMEKIHQSLLVSMDKRRGFPDNFFDYICDKLEEKSLSDLKGL